MRLKNQKQIASKVLKAGSKRIYLDPSKIAEIKEAITRTDIRSLISQGIIKSKPKRGVSKVRARKLKLQKAKGRRKGYGSRKGKQTARLPKKKAWISKVRAQRNLLTELKPKLKSKDYTFLRNRVKGGFFRSRRHIKLYITEQGFIKK
ncbi:50S ribosomal protein L19e [archaeon]|nr:50S ribosomal protein L19e [archaeon]|tara:strand:- start:1375 stop:1818 length:444 start_codon:yes stop_codon:yes gene_type:complete